MLENRKSPEIKTFPDCRLPTADCQLRTVMQRALIILFFIPFMLNAQMPNLVWNRTYGGKSEEKIHALAEAGNGYLLAVGETESDTEGGKDGLLLMVDFSTGEPIVEQKIGGKKDDVFKAIVQTYDGHFLIAGYTESSGNGKKDGWLVKVNDKGEMIWDLTFGGAKDDEFREMVMAEDQSIILSGYKDDRKSGDVWVIRLLGQEKKYEKTYGNKEYESLQGMSKTKDGGVVLVGNTSNSSKRKNGDIWVLKTRNNGDTEWEKFFGEKNWEEALEVITTNDGNFAVAGLTSSMGKGELDYWLLKISPAGYLLWENTFGGRDIDIANGLSETSDKGFLLTGKSKSYQSGARNFKNMVVKTTANGDLEWKYDLGGNKEDEGRQALMLHDGSLALAGITESKGSGGNDAWIFRFDRTAPVQLPGAKAAQIELKNLDLNTNDGYLKPNEITFLKLELENNYASDLEDVQITLQNQNETAGIQFWNQNFIGKVESGEKRLVRIPFSGDSNVKNAENEFKVTVSTGRHVLKEFPITVGSRTLKPATFKASFALEELPTVRASQRNALKAIIVNEGDFPSKNVEVAFLSESVKPLGNSKFNLGIIGPGIKEELLFNFQKNQSEGDIVCIIREGGKEVFRELIPVSAKGEGLKEGVALWVSPDPDATNTTTFPSDKPIIDVWVKVASPSPMTLANIRHSADLEDEDSKFDEENLTPTAEEKGMYSYSYKARVHLEKGMNDLEIVVELEDGTTFSSKGITVEYNPKINLHVLAIGTPHSDLQYTVNDANDFAQAFENQGNSDLVNKVFVNKLTTPEETTLDGIRQGLNEILNRFESDAEDAISKRDILMVFISSHGMTYRDRFKILPSDFNSNLVRATTIDYKYEILGFLEEIDCRKVILIDACHSGGAKDVGLSKALQALHFGTTGLHTITSSQADQLSYEDDSWQNGAFTEAILDAFSGKTFTSDSEKYKADKNDDRLITLGELYAFLKIHVPNLVAGEKGKLQVPKAPKEDLEADLPIYWLKG